MLVWTTVFGAVLGWFGADFEGHGLIVGGLIGWVFGWGMRRAIRAEVRAATKAILEKIDSQPLATPKATSREVPLPEAPSFRPQSLGQSLDEQPHVVKPAVSQQNLAPAKPNKSAFAFSAIVSAVQAWLLGGNAIVRVGLVVLFVGLSFLASYAASAGLFPVEMRLALVGAFGAGLLLFGFRARLQRPNFGLALQGGGVATIYLTLFAATRLIDGFPLFAALLLMILVCALGCALALFQRSQALAVTAFAGGFAAPLLFSTGSKEIAILFGYCTLLNLAILFIARKRSWRGLNLVGFLSTFAIMTLLAASGHDPSQYGEFQAFLIASVLIHVATSVYYTAKTPSRVEGHLQSRLGNGVDATLLFGTALVGFGIQVSLVGDRPFGSAVAALAFGALYIAVSVFTAQRQPTTNRVLSEAMLAIGIGFVTLAVPLAFGAGWTSAVWALQGAGAFWVGMRQARWLPRLFGLILQGVAAFVYLFSMGPNIASLPFTNAAFMGAMLIALATLATAWWLRHELAHSGSRFAVMYARGEAALGKPAFLFGFVFWWLAFSTETSRLLPAVALGLPPTPVYSPDMQALLAMLAFVVSAFGFQILARRNQWRVAIWPSAISLAALVMGFLSIIGMERHVLYLPGCFIWIIAIALHARMLYLNDHDEAAIVTKPLLIVAHVGGVLLATAIFADCMWLAIDHRGLWNTSWAGIGFLANLVAVLLALTVWATRSLSSHSDGLGWPLDRYRVAYGWLAALPIVGLITVGTLATALFASGDTDPIPYLPILNPVDLVIAFALATLILWRKTALAAKTSLDNVAFLNGRVCTGALSILAFIAINTAWLRITHQLLGVEWAGHALFNSVIVQTGLAILWTTLALPLMVIAHRRLDRGLWLAGAGLLGLTVAKLVLVDLNNTGGGARIIAFIAVGVLMLVVGYVAPLPPRAVANDRGLKNEPAGQDTP